MGMILEKSVVNLGSYNRADYRDPLIQNSIDSMAVLRTH